ncbi:MAG: DNA recombination protein RmuC [Candidatus Algichlamydia australiensis]|nr:DNA recombination protein RmuC [Chlamydiales bacterium]
MVILILSLLLGIFGILLLLKEKKVIELKAELKGSQERERFLQETKEEMQHTFKSLSSDALEKNNRSFMQLAGQMVEPMKESLGKLDKGMREIEKERKGEHASLKTQMEHLAQSEKELKRETERLVRALKRPGQLGKWGELQLRRVVELAGLKKHCDFVEQKTIDVGGNKIRPDLIVQLPGEKQIIVDSKAPFDAYLEAMETEEEGVRALKLKEHAKAIRHHVMDLSKRKYFESVTLSPEFVVLFLPSEGFFSAALEVDPGLMEMGLDQGVILSTPTTLIALLRSVAYGWKQEAIANSVQEVSKLGHELYKRISDMNTHFAKLGRQLQSSVDAYNSAMGSYESRVLVSARRFQELGAASKERELTELMQIDKSTRQLDQR